MGSVGTVGGGPIFDVVANNQNINLDPGTGKVVCDTQELKIGDGTGTSKIV